MIKGIKNIFKWFRIIWNDRWWDYRYILIILKHKLELTEKEFRKNGHHVHANRDADNIHICILLINRLLAANYCETEYDKHFKKWGDLDFSFEEKDGVYKLDLKQENVITKEDEEQSNKEFRRISYKEAYMERQDVEYLFHLMKKYLLTWWD